MLFASMDVDIAVHSARHYVSADTPIPLDLLVRLDEMGVPHDSIEPFPHGTPSANWWGHLTAIADDPEGFDLSSN